MIQSIYNRSGYHVARSLEDLKSQGYLYIFPKRPGDHFVYKQLAQTDERGIQRIVYVYARRNAQGEVMDLRLMTNYTSGNAGRRVSLAGAALDLEPHDVALTVRDVPSLSDLVVCVRRDEIIEKLKQLRLWKQ